jgi:NTE family protein
MGVGLCAWFLVFVMTLCGCEYVRPTPNAPLTQWEPPGGYRFSNLAPPEADNTDGLFIMASFSGGGTRASKLAFGVLRELARQQITWEGKKKRLLDELDAMFALSGGTFTAGYYALYGDQIFHDFEHRFLRKDWESELKSRILRSPSNCRSRRANVADEDSAHVVSYRREYRPSDRCRVPPHSPGQGV